MPATGIIAALVAILSWGFIEGLARFYPNRQTWWRLRRARGREPLRRTRLRFEEGARWRGPRVLAAIVFSLLVAWVASASLLDKKWYEVVADVAPSAVVMVALLRVPHTLRAIAARMKGYEREAGDDPDDETDEDDGGLRVVAL